MAGFCPCWPAASPPCVWQDRTVFLPSNRTYDPSRRPTSKGDFQPAGSVGRHIGQEGDLHKGLWARRERIRGRVSLDLEHLERYRDLVAGSDTNQTDFPRILEQLALETQRDFHGEL